MFQQAILGLQSRKLAVNQSNYWRLIDMAIKKNPLLETEGLIRRGQRWRLDPIVVKDLDVAYLDLESTTGPVKPKTTDDIKY